MTTPLLLPLDLEVPGFVSALRLVDLTGVLLMGVLGGSLGRLRRFDLVGVAVLGLMSALGGGVIRDTLLQQGPPVALIDPLYLVVALAGAALAALLRLDGPRWRRFFIVGDAVALGCWAGVGALKALDAGLGPLPAVLLGVITAVGGGMVRDIAIGQVPSVFGGNTLYATAAVAAAAVVVLFPPDLRDQLGLLVALAVGAGLCLLARWRRWQLPEEDYFGIRLTRDQLARLIRRVERQSRRGATRGSGTGPRPTNRLTDGSGPGGDSS